MDRGRASVLTALDSPTRPVAEPLASPPACVVDFLWNVHTVLVDAPGPLPLVVLKQAYLKLFGYQCAFEKFLVMGEGGLVATLKRVLHALTLLSVNGVICACPSQAAGISKQQWIVSDQLYRRELVELRAAESARATM